MRRILMFLMLLALTGCKKDRPETGDLTHHIPSDASVILKLDNPDLFFSNLKNNEFLKTNRSHPLPKHLKEQLSFLENFSHKNPAFLSFSPSGKNGISFAFISTGNPEIKNIDSIQDRSVETFRTPRGEIKRFSLNGRVTYTTSKDSIFIVSNSKALLEKNLENAGGIQLPNSRDFEKALKASSEKKASIFINHHNFPEIFKELLPGGSLAFLEKFSNWSSLDADITQNSVKLNGITTATDTLPKFINLFKEVLPSRNELASMAPIDSDGFYSFSFRDYGNLKRNLENHNGIAKKTETPESELLASASEAGIIYLESAQVFAVKTHNAEASELSVFNNETAEDYRDIRIYKYPGKQEFHNLLSPLVKLPSFSFFLFHNQFFLFSEDLESLRKMVRDIQNKNTLEHMPSYKSAMENLTTEASVLMVGNNPRFRGEISESVAPEFRRATSKLDFRNFPLTAVQLIYNGNFAHIHAVLEKTEGRIEEKGIRQTASISLDAPLATPPTFFRNHRSKGLDIAVQDNRNTLYLISEKGKIFWKKELPARILGKVQQVDLFRNGRIQLAFATQNGVHIIDREGNDVKPFPLKFKDEITQPLAIFDYNNTRDYRFVIVQNKEVLMIDTKGRRVKGFKFRKAGEEILHPPKHIRLGTKDYILIAEASGKLNILNRTGTSRVPVREDLDFSGNQWYEYNNRFVSTNKQGELLNIDEKGRITRKNLGLPENHEIDATAKTLATLYENILTIKGKTVNLDFGLYTRPEIFYINNKLYISVTDIQAHRVYLFDSNAELLPNFPVYGNSAISLGNADGDHQLEFVVQGDGENLLVYELQ